LPPFCRVAGTIAPVPESAIRFEVWLPKTWNGKFVGIGNAGASGLIFYPEMAEPLSRGYAVAATDTGHSGGMGDWSFAAHREQFIDFGYRAIHEMTLKSKAVVEAHYQRAARRSYWHGCSSGGRQGLTTAHRFPEDYDGIIARAPAIKLGFQSIRQVLIAQATTDPVEPLTPDKLTLMTGAAIAACDAADGVRDRTVNDPMACRFDPGVLACKAGDRPDCLTPRQVTWARQIYRGVRDATTDEQVLPGLLPTSEVDWVPPLFAADMATIATSYFRHVLLNDPKWDRSRLDLAADVARARTREDEGADRTDPDLGAFVGRGGKLLLWHGWSDGAIAPGGTLGYYDDVIEATRGDTTLDHVRLFMAPGVHHCAGGEGASQVDFLSVLDEWVERGKAPERITASRPLDGGRTRTRPLCPYPQVATYSGAGNSDDASSFVCKAPSRD
jgi:feruloyl esterase